MVNADLYFVGEIRKKRETFSLKLKGYLIDSRERFLG